MVCPVGDFYVQVGIVSWGPGCAEVGFPGFYANVMEVNGWIRENSKIGNVNNCFLTFIYVTDYHKTEITVI